MSSPVAGFSKSVLHRLTRPISIQPLLAGLIAVCIVVLFTADWMLLRHSKRLTSALQARAVSMVAKEGSRVPAMQGWTTAGEMVTLGYSNEPRKTLMFVFSTECAIADANWPNWEAMVAQVDTAEFRLVYANIATSFPESYDRTHYFHPDALVLTRVDPQSAVDYSLSLSPMVLLLGADGTVEAVWLGMTNEALRRKMEATLRITLAGSERSE